MAFVLKELKDFWWPCVIKTPGQNSGQYDVQELDLNFKLVKESELNDLLDKKLTNKEFCKLVVLGWKDIKDEKGEEIKFSPSSFEKLLDYPKYAKQIADAFLEALRGTFAEKN